MIYFIYELREGGAIKIGYAKTNIENRINQMQTGNPSYLELRGVMVPGTKRDEAKLHRQFRHSRIRIGGRGRKRITFRGEWFEPTPELMELIDSLPQYPPPSPPIIDDYEPEVVQ